jgi:hypothetical protein
MAFVTQSLHGEMLETFENSRLSYLPLALGNRSLLSNTRREAGQARITSFFAILGKRKEFCKEGLCCYLFSFPPNINVDTTRCLELEGYLDVLKAGDKIDVHDFQSESNNRMPKKLKASTAIQRLLDAERAPINMLNLRGYKSNSIPTCIADIPNYNLLTTIDGLNGKKTSRQHCDLRESSTFQLLAKRGALHLTIHYIH